MTIQTLALAACITLLPLSAFAHEKGHGDDKPLATTCAQLANPQRYEVDPAYPEIKALQARCDAENRAKAEPATKK
jgi:hypothetical protein